MERALRQDYPAVHFDAETAALRALGSNGDSMLRTVIESMHDPVLLVDKHLGLLETNDCARELLGLPRECCGIVMDASIDPGEVRDADGRVLTYEDATHVRCLMGEEIRNSEQIHICKDGTRRCFIVNGSPIRGPHGEIEMALIVGREITDLKELQFRLEAMVAEIEAQKTRLSTIIQSTPVPIIVTDGQWRVTAHNRAADELARALGLRGGFSESSALSFSEQIEFRDQHGEPMRHDDGPIARSLNGESCTDVVVHAKAKGRRSRVLSVNTAPLRDGRGRPIGVLTAMMDITERARAQEQIEDIYLREHAIAEKLQTSFVPGDLPRVSGFEIGQVYCPGLDEAMVGGDFYDSFWIDEARLGVVIADVAGKGLNAAVYTAMTKYMLRAYALEESAPELALARLNEALTACTPFEVFVTLVYGILDTRDRTFTYANAGHEPPLFYSRQESIAVTLDVTGRALALVHGASYTTQRVALSPGDVIVLDTDGVTDAGSGADRLGHGRTLALVEARAGREAAEIAGDILNTALDYAGGKLGDDAALVVIKAANPECG